MGWMAGWMDGRTNGLIPPKFFTLCFGCSLSHVSESDVALSLRTQLISLEGTIYIGFWRGDEAFFYMYIDPPSVSSFLSY